jgi:thiol-disulfide isomerase/thioredoxin
MLPINEYYSYDSFFEWTGELAANNESSGAEQTEEHKKFTQLNYKRMERWNKNFILSEPLANIISKLDTKQTWVLITETWCGDSAQLLPGIAKIAAASGGLITLKIILRDENPDWINAYLTNGTKSVPKLISFDENGTELFVWGPRPQGAIEIHAQWKANADTIDKDQFHVNLHTWYGKDKGAGMQLEFEALLSHII